MTPITIHHPIAALVSHLDPDKRERAAARSLFLQRSSVAPATILREIEGLLKRV